MNTKELNAIVARALREDAARADITSIALIPKAQTAKGAIIVKEDAVLCGLTAMKKVFQTFDKSIRFQTRFSDGKKVKRNTVIATLKGKTRSILAAERVALNFLGYLSGIATNTQKYVSKTRGCKAKIYDTRKTTPTLRMLEKYAVSCGGGNNHRFDLKSFVLIKDNHRQACSPEITIPGAIKRVENKTRKTIEIEVDTLAQLKQALTARPDIILLDNMNLAQIKKAVAMARAIPAKHRPLLEASGGITLENVAKIAKAGVDRISTGSLTHSRKSVDVSLELKK